MSTIFISYAHQDEELKDEIESYVKMLVLNRPDLGRLVWSDRDLLAGDDWEAEIEKVMERASLALLIVTRNFLLSEFIRDREIPYLDERERTHGLRVFPIIADVCPWEDSDVLRRLEHRPKGKHALSELSEVDRKRALNDLYYELASIAAVPSPSPSSGTPAPAAPLSSFTSADASPTVEFGFSHYKRDLYRVELRYSNPASFENDRTLRYESELDVSALEAMGPDARAYAAELDRRIVPRGGPSQLLDIARSASRGGDLRLRIAIDPTAIDLHAVHWETLQQAYASTSGEGPRIVFSRYASAGKLAWPDPVICSWRDPRLALLDLRPRGGSPLDAFEHAFQEAGFDCFRPQPESDPVSLEQMNAPVVFVAVELATGGGAASAQIRTADGLVSGEDMAAALRRRGRQVQVLILHADDATALTSIASDLVAAGVCAVVTRQAEMELSAWTSFLQGFLRLLAHKGNIDDSAHAGRSQVSPETEAWKPAVLTRLRTGQIWFRPCFVGDKQPDVDWDLVVKRVQKGKVVPILGPGVSQYLMRSNAEIADLLAEKFQFPLAGYETTNLKKVAQYIATMRERDQVIDEFVDGVRSHAMERYGGVAGIGREDSALDMLEGLWRDVISKLDDDPYLLLGRLRAPLYFTTTFHNFLSLAIRDQIRSEGGGAWARDRILTLDKGILNSKPDADDTSFIVSPDDPMIYYLFGRIDQPKTLVLTEDDHFRFLLNFKEQWRSLPEKVVEWFSDSALLFLGFDLDSWDFRALFRGILELENSNEIRRTPHVAVQISPDDDRLRDPEKTRAYLREYFGQISEKPLLFLGSAQDFLGELVKRLG